MQTSESLSVDNKDASLGSSHYCQSQSYKQSDLQREREKKEKWTDLKQ